MIDDEPVERWVAVDAADVESIIGGEQVEATMHEAGEESGEIDRTYVTVECVGGLPDSNNDIAVAFGMGLGLLIAGIGLVFTTDSPYAAEMILAGVATLAIVTIVPRITGGSNDDA